LKHGMKSAGGSGIHEILNGVSDAVVLLGPGWTVSYVNPEAARLAGRDPESCAGSGFRDVFEFVHRLTREPVVVEPAAETEGKAEIMEFPLHTVLVGPDGEDVPVSGTVFPPGFSGGGYGGVVFRDIGARWLIHRSLIDLHGADTMKTIARSMVGNVNDLLTVLLARLVSIERSCSEGKPIFKHVGEIKKLAEKVGRLVAGLAGGRVSHGAPDTCDVPKVLASAASVFSTVFPSVDFTVAYPERTGFAGITSGLMEQVVTDLLMNAGRAAGNGGKVVLAACRIELGEDLPPVPRGDWVMTTVWNDGPGMSPEDMKRVFDPFFSRWKKEFGLGLPTVYSIVDGCGGLVTMDSGRGRGSVFTVFLPAAAGVAVEASEDVVPVVTAIGLSGDPGRKISTMLRAVGCEEEPPKGADVMRMAVVEYDAFVSGGMMPGRNPEWASGMIVLGKEGIDRQPFFENGVIFLEPPFTLDKLARSVTLAAWKRESPVYRPGSNRIRR